MVDTSLFTAPLGTANLTRDVGVDGPLVFIGNGIAHEGEWNSEIHLMAMASARVSRGHQFPCLSGAAGPTCPKLSGRRHQRWQPQETS